MDAPELDEAGLDEAGLDEAGLDEAELESGRKLFAGSCDFIAAAASIASLPPMDTPEVAFAGRSNVGKSSLVNALTGRRTLARISQTPGRTKQLIFFDLAGQIRLVDLPGYGYARASKADIKAWTGLTTAFLKGRQTLRRVFLLVDSRRGILDIDRKIMGVFDASAVSWALVLTKCDTLKPAEQTAAIASAEREAAMHVAAWPGVFATSARVSSARATSARATSAQVSSAGGAALGIASLRGHIAALVPPQTD